MHERDQRIITGLFLVLAMLIVVPLGALTFTGLTIANPGEQRPDIATPVFLTLLIGCCAVLYFVFRNNTKN